MTTNGIVTILIIAHGVASVDIINESDAAMVIVRVRQQGRTRRPVEEWHQGRGPLVQGTRITARVEQHFKDNGIASGRLNHHKPSAYFLSEQVKLLPNLSTGTARPGCRDIQACERLRAELNV